MNRFKYIFGCMFCLVVVYLSSCSSTRKIDYSYQVSKLQVCAPSQETIDKFKLDAFYKKHLNLDGVAIVSSEKVDDYAIKEAAYLMKCVLQNRPDIFQKLAENNVRFSIMAYDELTTQVPEHSDLEPSKFWDRRARGLGPTKKRPSVSCGEENLLCYPGDPYHEENILIHEFAHAIHLMAINDIDPTFDERLEAAYEDAMAKGLWKDKYAANNSREYWAEAVQSYFDDNRLPDHDHNHVNTRVELFEYDPAIAKLVQEQLADIDWKYKKPSKRHQNNTLHLAGYDGSNKPTFVWPKKLQEWYDNYQKEQKEKKDKS